MDENAFYKCFFSSHSFVDFLPLFLPIIIAPSIIICRQPSYSDFDPHQHSGNDLKDNVGICEKRRRELKRKYFLHFGWVGGWAGHQNDLNMLTKKKWRSLNGNKFVNERSLKNGCGTNV
jgi:hypothetical protein